MSYGGKAGEERGLGIGEDKRKILSWSASGVNAVVDRILWVTVEMHMGVDESR